MGVRMTNRRYLLLVPLAAILIIGAFFLLSHNDDVVFLEDDDLVHAGFFDIYDENTGSHMEGSFTARHEVYGHSMTVLCSVHVDKDDFGGAGILLGKGAVVDRISCGLGLTSEDVVLLTNYGQRYSHMVEIGRWDKSDNLDGSFTMSIIIPLESEADEIMISFGVGSKDGYIVHPAHEHFIIPLDGASTNDRSIFDDGQIIRRTFHRLILLGNRRDAYDSCLF